MTTKSERLTILSDAEQEALYSLPDFDDAQRLEYLALTETELAIASCRPGLHAQVYCVLQIGYFRAKHVFFRFDWNEVEDDCAFVLSRYFHGEAFEHKPIAKHEHYTQRKRIADLFGHPKLRNDLVHPSMEQIGGRVTLFEFDSLGPDRRAYLDWVLSHVSAAKTKPQTLLTDAAATLLCERLATPLQFELYLDRAFTEGFRVGQKPIDVDTIEAVLSPDLNAMGARLMRNGYNVKQLTDTLGVKAREVRSFLAGQLAAERTQELHDRLLAAGVPV